MRRRGKWRRLKAPDATDMYGESDSWSREGRPTRCGGDKAVLSTRSDPSAVSAAVYCSLRA